MFYLFIILLSMAYFFLGDGRQEAVPLHVRD